MRTDLFVRPDYDSGELKIKPMFRGSYIHDNHGSTALRRIRAARVGSSERPVTIQFMSTASRYFTRGLSLSDKDAWTLVTALMTVLSE